MKRQPIGECDRDGREICEGDVVEFTVEYGYGFGRKPPPIYDTERGTRMVDTVKIVDGVPYFWDEDINCGSLACRHAAHCRVIGNIHDIPKMSATDQAVDS